VQTETEVTPQVLIRALVLFQFKLLVDGLKDLLLIKAALVAVVLDLLIGGRQRGRFFQALLRGGGRFERWLNLYGARGFESEAPDRSAGDAAWSADGIALKVEDGVQSALSKARSEWIERKRTRVAEERVAG
jgi:hypothetical protein